MLLSPSRSGHHHQQGSAGPAFPAMIASVMSWRIAYFVAAVFTFLAGLISWLYLFFSFSWLPITFMTQTFLLIIGIIMVILDLPLRNANPKIIVMRHQIYKFSLFATRFTGRGISYMFLSTMIFSALWDLNISRFLGILLSVPVMAIGMYGTHVGWNLSKKLNRVRNRLLDTGVDQTEMTEREFSSLCESNDVRFDANELEYVINALTGKSSGERIIGSNEFHDWLKEGLLVIV